MGDLFRIICTDYIIQLQLPSCPDSIWEVRKPTVQAESPARSPAAAPEGPVTMSTPDTGMTAPSSPEDSSSGINAAIIGGVVAAVVVVVVVLVIVLLRYLYRHKGTYRTHEDKGSEFAENSDTALKNDPSLQEAIDESKKEYFI
ncbi:glycophorin-C-like [Hyla sarda]|uniref:glycophorin-C-like n=1 Tax=Hyla sarda TaxID=327740 RepID=UPI0024C2E83B|nr:glycophorin-C-like [Hyla sarda]